MTKKHGKFVDVIRAPFKLEWHDWDLCKKAAAIEGRSPSNFARRALDLATKKTLGKKT